MHKLKKVLLASLLAVGSASSHAYAVVSDPSTFYAMFQSPTGLVEFSKLKDGTLFGPDALSSPLVRSTSSPPFSVSVREEAWTDDLFIGSSLLDCSCGWSATTWYGDYISPEFYSRIYIRSGGVAMPIALDTSAGFLGFIPDSLSDSYFLLPAAVSVNSVQYGFTKVASVPEPGSIALLASGLGFLGFARVRKSRTRGAAIEPDSGA